ncbi:type II secretion system protein E [methanotrophic bacterial endosymbiont of Bathymodiolus sp.]|jgi:type IV secretion system protein VirB11|uniref:P-type conjugative transfer ATPase TrbB n=1 Tax=Bacteria TaxID=2 RepID=UPI00086F6505|nr:MULTISPECIES: P-type conjugative transfer ATPase TrbB [Bacteria]SCN46947.1 Conjugative transfer protein TrbB [methanotrophic endosymbiont of Bathymodiolus azoricus (Menez Gwen)]SHE23297.1 Conjugative transfer protein TrbB [methanotrophic endosymbiont of Bathymodiolus puteoserpentis (Logatchev)]SMG65146.1 type II secretion system protein E [methanotrophic bacterial endosymbiont of Bathymodiolus sp.]
MKDISDEVVRRKQTQLTTALDPVLHLLNDADVVEVMINPDTRVWVERIGEPPEQTDIQITTAEIERAIRLVASIMQTTISTDNPSVAGTLPQWNARIQASMPPMVDSPALCIRLPAKKVFNLNDYVAKGILTVSQSQILHNAVMDRKNILLGGGTGSGKTTLANALLDVISVTGDRVIIIEDNRELQCNALNKVHFYTDANVSLQRALFDSLRWRPDRIIIGEVRDKAALDLLKAWNTGHPGGVATIHADSTREMLTRMCQLIEENNMVAPKAFVAQTIDLCVHIKRDKNSPAGRCLSGISEVTGYKNGEWLISPVD